MMNTYFEEQGCGPAIVFIHGSYATTSTWKKMVDQLSIDHQCISIKLPGHCGTPDPDDFAKPTIDTEITIIEQVVRSLTHEPVHLVGHSFGGVIALALALKGRLNISQVSLFEPVAVWVLKRVKDKKMLEEAQQFLSRYRRDVFNKVPQVYGQVIDFWGGSGAFESLPDFIKNAMEPLVENNIRHWNMDAAIHNTVTDLQSCQIPMRIICGDQSNPVARAIAAHLSCAIPNNKQYLIKGASHFLVTSHVEECLAVLKDEAILKGGRFQQ